MKCEICGKDGFHKLSCPNNKKRQKRFLVDIMQADEEDGLYNKAVLAKRAERIIEKSRIAKRKLRYTKCATPKVKRSKDVEP